jgi:hemolysin activation/secretion protein
MNNLEKLFFLFLLCFLPISRAYAGFLEMPSIQEVPEAENDILLKDLDIPPVRERDPHPEAGPRLNVTAFRLQGIVEFPALGITRESVIKLVESLRYDIMKEDERLDIGYTLEELGELQDELAEIERETRGHHVGAVEAQRLVFLIREQRRRRGVTLGMLEQVADQVTDYYRQRGFVLAKAFIPEQKVREGVVTITLLLGYLGDVKLVGAQTYSEDTIRKMFRDVLHQPVNSLQIEERLFYVNDLPGLYVQGVFAPGEQVGDTLLDISTVKEERYQVNVRADNHGSDVTGEYRVYTDFLLNNPLKYGDRLHLAVLGAFEPETTSYGMARYAGPLGHHRLKFETGASQNAFASGLGADSEIGGKSTTYDLGANFYFNRSRVKTTSVSLTASRVYSEKEFRGGGTRLTIDEDKIDNVELEYKFDLLNQEKRTVHIGDVRLIHTRMRDSRSNYMPEDGWLIDASYTTMRFLNTSFLHPETRLVLRANGHYAGRRTASINQFSLAGPSRARGYQTNTFYADDGLHLGADLVFQGPDWFGKNNHLQPYLLADAAHGAVYNYLGQKSRADIFNVGFGSKISWGNFRANFSAAFPLKTKISGNPGLEEIDDSKWYFDMQYTF